MRFDASDTSFMAQATLWVESLGDPILADLAATFDASPGYYPTTLLKLRRQEMKRRGLSASPQNGMCTGSSGSLPVCHPGDYEWRFTTAAARLLLDTATNETHAGEAIVHVGTPTTFALGTRTHPNFRHVLLERNTSVIAALSPQKRKEDEIIHIDLGREPMRPLQAAAAIVDPPWYLGDTTAFLSATSCACRQDASIVLCQPTEATRPGIGEERMGLLSELRSLGLEHTGTQVALVRYQTPHFEAMSLTMSLSGERVPEDWRKGDLLLLKKVASCQRDVLLPKTDAVWQEVRFGPVRIKVRSSGDEDLASIVPSDMLDTVSRRDPVRERIGLWTSGNRVYGLADPHRIGSLITMCHSDFMMGRFAFARASVHARGLSVQDATARKLFDILLLEMQEHLLREEFH
jgi:hypothetical protein